MSRLKDTIQVNVRLPGTLVRYLENEADQKGLNRSELIRFILETYRETKSANKDTTP